MKIALFSIYRLGNETGVAKISELICSYLAKKHEVLYVCSGNKFFYGKRKTLLYKTLEIPSTPIRQGSFPKLTPEIVEKVYQTLDQFSPDIIHAQNIALTALVCQLWAIRNSIPFITTFHNIPTEGIGWIFPKLSKSKTVKRTNLRLAKIYLGNILNNTDLIIALNESVKNSILKIVDNKDKVIVHGNGINLDSFLTLKIKKPIDKKIFTFLGSYIPRKNQEYLLDTFKYLPDNYHLNCYGNKKTGKEYVKKLEKLIKKQNIRNVSIKGFLSEKQVQNTLENTDYFVSASLKEAQSLVIIESLASGTPVIGLRNETIDELVNSNNGLSFSKSTKPYNFANQLNTYINKNEEDYIKNANYCRQSVADLDIGNKVNQLENYYKKAIQKKKKVKKDESMIIDPIPKQFQKYFGFTSSRPREKKTTRIRLVLWLTMIMSQAASYLLETIPSLKAIKKTITNITSDN